MASGSTMRPRTAKTLSPLDQSSHPATASALDNEGSSNGVSRSARSDGVLKRRAAFSVSGGTRKRRAAASGGEACCMLTCCAAWAKTCSTGSMISNAARTMEMA